MKARVQRWGNSLAVRIPKPVAQETGLDANSPVDITLEEGRLIITPQVPPPLDLDALLAQVTDDNLHGEVDCGPALGHEVW